MSSSKGGVWEHFGMSDRKTNMIAAVGYWLWFLLAFLETPWQRDVPILCNTPPSPWEGPPQTME